MYTGNLFSYLRSMGVRVPDCPRDDSRRLTVVKAFGNGFTGSFFPSTEEYAVSVETDKVLEALRVVMKACSSEFGIILVSEGRQDILTMLQNRLKDEKSITVLGVEGYSVAGLDNVLGEYMPKVRSYAGKAFSAAESPPLVYSGLELLRAWDALIRGKPVTRALVYCGGEVASPGFYDVPVGTKYSDVVEACGPLPPAGGYSLLVGDLSKSSLHYGIERDISAPVKKNTEKLIVLSLSHPLLEKAGTPLTIMLKRISSVCNQCRLCTDMCPVNLNGGGLYPHLVVRDVAEGRAADSPWIAGADLCISCGVCTAVCPAGISPMQINEFIKGVIHESGGGDRSAVPSAVSDYTGNRNNGRLPVEKLAERFGLNGHAGGADTSVRTAGSEQAVPIAGTVGAELPVHTMSNISMAEIVLSQAGANAKPAVKAGDLITAGSVIADGGENSEPSLHASISGKLSVVDDNRIVIVSAGE